MEAKKVSTLFKILKCIVKAVYPKIEVEGTENLPKEAAIYVGNHSQMHGPLACEFHFPVERYTWCAGQMMELKEVPAYAYQDFWSSKPKYIRWFYKILSYLIAPLAVCLFNNANTIAVHRDNRILSTFRNTVKTLEGGASVVIFPECYDPYNNIIYQFQERFIDVAKLYYKKTGVEVEFVPFYLAPNLRKMYFGKPIRFCATNPIEEERKKIRTHLMTEITEIAQALPEHIVVPYPNMPKKNYPTNIPVQEAVNEETSC